MVSLLEKRKKRTGSVLAAFALLTFGLHLLTLFLLIVQGLTIRQLSLAKTPTFVQLIDGKPVTVTQAEDLEREPQAIRQFVSNTMTSMFNWSGTLPVQTVEQATKPLPDAGISIKAPQGYNKRIATSSWIASFALSEDLRKDFLRQIADLTPLEVFSNNPTQAMSAQLIIKQISRPEKIEPGLWRVGIVADLVQKKRFQEDKKVIVPFNKDVIVRAVNTYAHPQPDMMTDLQKAVYAMRSEKMEIAELRNLCLLDGYGGSIGNNSCQESIGDSDSFTR
ncbi:hypothetical protein NUACC21_39930 [Scytonema sp. NUACC21]